jgi:hypothetical protein
LHVFNQLIGIEETKPFDCIGTVDEINAALYMTLGKMENINLPFLLKYYIETDNYKRYKGMDGEELLNQFNEEHFLESELVEGLKLKVKS